MIILAIRIDNYQHKWVLETRGTYTFSNKRYKNIQKPSKRDQYEMVPIELDATEKHNKTPQKKTHKCYNCRKIGHLAKVCRSKKQANATQSKKQKDRRKRDLREVRQLNATKK